MTIRLMTRTLYLLTGLGGVLLALAVLLAPTGLIPGRLQGSDDPDRLHLAQEFGSATLMVGVMGFWCFLNYRRARAVHGFLVVFFGAIALVHWLAHFRGSHPLSSGLVNSVPFLLFAVTAVLRRRDSVGE